MTAASFNAGRKLPRVGSTRSAANEIVIITNVVELVLQFTNHINIEQPGRLRFQQLQWHSLKVERNEQPEMRGDRRPLGEREFQRI